MYLRKGELEAVSVSKKCDRAVFKMKGRPTLFVPLKEVDVATATATGNLHDGLGQSRDGICGNEWLNRGIDMVQRGPYGRETQFVDMDFKVPPQYEILILKRNHYFNANKIMSSTRQTNLKKK